MEVNGRLAGPATTSIKLLFRYILAILTTNFIVYHCECHFCLIQQSNESREANFLPNSLFNKTVKSEPLTNHCIGLWLYRLSRMYGFMAV